MSEKWEYVVKGGKHKQKSQMSTKEIKQIKENNLNGNKYTRGIDEETDQSISPELIKVQSKNKIKNKVSQNTDGENNLNQQISKLNSEDIKSIHKDLSGKFPNQNTVILMDLALHINLMLKPSDESLKNISFENIDFPYGFLLNDTKSALRGVFTALNNVQLGSFLKSAMIQIVDDNDKGIKSIGLLMLVQVCLKMKPTALIANRKTIFELLNMYREQTVKFKCLVWVLKQACLNFNLACQIWLIYLLPFISQRCHSETVLLFGEEMMNYPTDIGGNDSALLHTDFLPIVDLVFNQSTEVDSNAKKGKRKQMNFQLVPAHLQRLGIIYHKIKDQVFAPKAAGSFKDYFASLFFRLSPKNKNEDFNKELLDCLDHCLIACPDSIKQLELLCVGHPQQTTIFLDHFKSGKSLAAALILKQKPYKTLIDKIHSSALASDPGSFRETSQDAMKPYQRRSSKSGSCLWTLLRVVLYAALLAMFTGVVLSYQYPQHYRVLESKLRPRYDWLVETTTPYYRHWQARAVAAVKVAEPYAVAVAEKVRVKAQALWLLSRPYLETAAARVGEAGQYLYGKMEEMAPDMLDRVSRGYLAMETYVNARVADVHRFLTSRDLEAAVRSLSDRVGSVGEQVNLGCKTVVAYMLKVVGY